MQSTFDPLMYNIPIWSDTGKILPQMLAYYALKGSVLVVLQMNKYNCTGSLAF